MTNWVKRKEYKTFPKSDKVNHSKVTFHNRYGITLAAVDFLSVQEMADPGKISIIGICGWGGMALNAACIDTRIKATVTSPMYDMSRVTAEGYFGSSNTADARYAMKEQLNAQHTQDYRSGEYKLAGGLPEDAPEDAPFFVKDFVAYYKKRAYHKRSLNSNGGWNVTSPLSLFLLVGCSKETGMKTPMPVLRMWMLQNRMIWKGVKACKQKTG